MRQNCCQPPVDAAVDGQLGMAAVLHVKMTMLKPKFFHTDMRMIAGMARGTARAAERAQADSART